MSNLFGLPDIHFAEKDAAEIKRGIIVGFEKAFHEATGERLTLYPADPRQLFLSTIADIIVLQRNLIDYTGKQNMLAFADNTNLDHLGLILAVKRLESSPALVTMRYALSVPLASAYMIPAGTRCTPDGKIFFASVESAEIPPGETYADVPSKCTETGASGNGFLPGQINRLVDPLPWIQSVENVTESAGGADTEGDENLRERIHLAPESFSVAGPRGAYEFWAKSAHQSIVDVSVVGPPETDPGNVEIYPLLEDGELPGQEILDLVYAMCNADDIRPDTDHVFVLPPEPVSFDLSVTYWIDRRNVTQAAAIKTAVERAAADWELWQRSALGRDINPSELNHRMIAAGAKRTDISSPGFTVLNYKQVGVASLREIIYGGIEDG
jgi:phage-related baseplate assembly protein